MNMSKQTLEEQRKQSGKSLLYYCVHVLTLLLTVEQYTHVWKVIQGNKKQETVIYLTSSKKKTICTVCSLLHMSFVL